MKNLVKICLFSSMVKVHVVVVYDGVIFCLLESSKNYVKCSDVSFARRGLLNLENENIEVHLVFWIVQLWYWKSGR